MTRAIRKFMLPFVIIIIMVATLALEGLSEMHPEDFSLILIYFVIFTFTYRGVKFVKWIFVYLLLITPAVLILIDTFENLQNASIMASLTAIVMIVYAGIILFDHDVKTLLVQNARTIKLEDQLLVNAYKQRFQFPTLRKRYISSLIDGLLLLIVVILIILMFGKTDDTYILKIFLIVSIVLLYEPLSISYKFTLGQYVSGIRVISSSNPGQKINFVQSLLRYLTKITLGWLSFVTIMDNDRKRAIHDFVGNSVVVIR